jgi:holin-like protein
MLETLLLLLIFQLLGEVVVHLAKVPIPGAVVGMALAFLGLLAFPRFAPRVDATIGAITRNMALFFVPAGAGLIQYLELWRHFGVAIVITIIFSTLITAAVTGLVFKLALRLEGKHV